MSIKSVAKSDALIRDLKDRLEYRLASASLTTIREAKDAEGYPVLFVSAGNEAAGQPVFAVRISQIDAVSKDILGNDLKAYTPHKMELAYEAGSLSVLQYAILSHECYKCGVAFEIKEIADGTPVTIANINSASGVSIQWDARFPTKGM